MSLTTTTVTKEQVTQAIAFGTTWYLTPGSGFFSNLFGLGFGAGAAYVMPRLSTSEKLQVAAYAVTWYLTPGSGFLSTVAALALGTAGAFTIKVLSVAKNQFSLMQSSDAYKVLTLTVNPQSNEFDTAFNRFKGENSLMNLMSTSKFPSLPPKPTEEEVKEWFKNRIGKNGASYAQFGLLAEKGTLDPNAVVTLKMEEVFFREMVHLANPNEISGRLLSEAINLTELDDKLVKNKVGGVIVSTDQTITYLDSAQKGYFIYDTHPTVGGLFKFSNRGEFFEQLKQRIPTGNQLYLQSMRN